MSLLIFMQSDFFHSGNAVPAHILVAVECQVSGGIAEHAGRLVLMENDLILCYIDFQFILGCDVQGPPQLDGKNDPAQLVDLP